MQTTRRDLAVLLPILGAIAAAQGDAADLPTLKSVVKKFEDLPSRTSGANGKNNTHAIFDGLTRNNFRIEAHETELAPGGEPHPPHHHVHEEMMLMVNGELDFTVNGKTTRIGPGGFGFAGSNDEHGVKNPSTTERARYFVIAFGPEK
ncbi:MAG TPA: cupin domain-containing protein [Bryobacteraceae bacterium]|nr:cupin domain-containing protein [Bryobacteraceae bacterium]